MSWYELKRQPAQLNQESHFNTKYKKIVCKSVDKFTEIVGTDLKKDEQYRFVTQKSFNAITVLQYILNHYEIEEIYLCIYRINNKSYDYLKNLINLDEVKTTIVVSSFFKTNKKNERWVNNINLLTKDKKNFRSGFAYTHTKIFLCKTKCGKYFVFEGSGNLSDNAKIEQYIFEDNKAVYKFHESWINNILKKQ